MKVVVKTIQTVVRTYFVDTPDAAWAADGIVCNELEEYSQKHLSEDILSTQVVVEWPRAASDESINAAVMRFDESINGWLTDVMWHPPMSSDKSSAFEFAIGARVMELDTRDIGTIARDHASLDGVYHWGVLWETGDFAGRELWIDEARLVLVK